MTENRYQEIREKYIKVYPHLAYIKSKRVFAQNALRLAAPETITGIDLLDLSSILSDNDDGGRK